MPQLPQLFGSFSGSVHVPLQVWNARPHTQALLMQVSARPQVVPQPPQLAGSFRVWTHEPLQTVRPAPQFLVHAPRLQT